MVLTTEKDAVRLMGWAAFSIPLGIVGIVLEMIPEDRLAFETWLLNLARAKTERQRIRVGKETGWSADSD
jgi:hypothetical protein